MKKTLNLLVLFLLAVLTVNLGLLTKAQSAELRSKKLRQLVCDEILKQTIVVQEEECLRGKLDIIGTDSISYKDKKYVVQLLINASIADSSFQLRLSRNVEFQVDKPLLKGWSAEVTNSKVDKVTEIILNTDVSSTNAYEISSDLELKKLPRSILNWRGDTSFLEVSADEYQYFAILSPEKSLVGYIAYIWYSSEEDDIKGFSSQSFDLNGKTVGPETSESFGYEE